jgi:ABC-type xylose transport system permease subunit
VCLTAAAGAFFGSLNGALVTWLGVPSIVATLATMAFWRELLRWITQGAWVQDLPATFQWMGLSQTSGEFAILAAAALLFALLAWSMVALLPSRLLSGATLSGAVVGAMLLVKPHALAVFLAVLLTLGALCIAPADFRPRKRAVVAGLALFIASTYVSLTCVNAILTRDFRLHPLLFVGEFYRPYLSQAVSISSGLDARACFSASCVGT